MATFVENINKLANGLPVDLLDTLDTIESDIDSIQVKLDTVEIGANNYTHPATHPVSIIDGSSHPSMVVKTDSAGVVGFGSVSWSEVDGKPVGFTPAEHTHDMTEVVTGNLSATRINETSELQFVTNDEKLIIAGAELVANKGANGGYAPLDMSGKIPSSHIPSLSVIDVFVVTSEAEMLASAANVGDIAVRQDIESQFILQAEPATSIDNWVQLSSSASVTTVNGQSGIVVLSSGDISETENLYYTAARVQAEIAAANDDVATLTNKIIDSHLNKVGANHVHYKVKATENLAVGDVVKIAGYQNGEDAIRVSKTTSLSDVAIGVVEHSIVNGEFGLVVNTGTVDGINTAAWTFGTILYSNGMGGFTNVKPTTDTYQACGYVMKVNSNNGSLLVEFTEPRDNYIAANLASLDV